ncbi:MAG: hypothetical protein R2697_21615 [Ilumatobacteraceae bacterium]
MAEPRGARPTEHEVYPGACGGEGPGGIRAHGPACTAWWPTRTSSSTGQSLTLRQDSYDRSSFMPRRTSLRRRIADHPGSVIGLDAYLGV